MTEETMFTPANVSLQWHNIKLYKPLLIHLRIDEIVLAKLCILVYAVYSLVCMRTCFVSSSLFIVNKQ